MDAAVMIGGFALEATAWWLVAFRRGDVWRVTVPALGAMGVAALVAGVEWSPEIRPWIAIVAGAASGAVLYLATRGFVLVVRGWEAFRRQSLAMYLRQGDRTLASALLLSLVVSVPGEELFWRGLFQPELADALAAGAAAILGWAAFVLANAPSWNLAILAGAVVGGGVWAGLGWWCGGALAPLASHVVWTGLMLAFPVVRPSDTAR